MIPKDQSNEDKSLSFKKEELRTNGQHSGGPSSEKPADSSSLSHKSTTRNPTRIPKSELDQLKESVDLVSLIQSYGVELKKHGTNDLIGHCPFHNDKTPSLIVTPSKGLWHCLGACGVGGDVIEWLRITQKVSFRQAVDLLREKDFSLLAATKDTKPHTLKKRLSLTKAPFTKDSSHIELLNKTTAYYHKTLLQNTLAMSYLKKRGIDNLEVIEKFQLGFSDRSLGNHLPESQSKEGKVLRPKLKEAGLYNKNGHEFMVGRITFPIFDDQKNVHNLYGRLINSPSRNTAKHVYLGSHKYFWNSEALDHPSKTLILCESIIDALSFYCHGYHNVTCAYGVNGLPEPMLNTLIKKGIKKIYIAYDGDEAGDKASNTLAEKLLGEGMECHRLHFPLNEDPNSFIRQVLTKGETTPQKALEILLNTSEWLGKTKPQTPTQTTLDTSPKESPSSFLAAETPAELNQLLTNISCIQKGSDYHLTLGSNSETRHYRVRGLHKNSTLDTLKVSLRLQHKEAMYLDTFDFYFNKFKETYIVKSANETGLKEDILKRDLGRIMLKLEQLQEERLAKKEETKAHSMSEKERKEALAFAKSPDLMKQILHHLTHCGHYGENYKKLFSYLATTSRLMQQPLSVLIQGSSGSGKTELMKSVLKFMPSEDVVGYSSMSAQSLYYMGTGKLKHKILSIEEHMGADKTSYPLKLLISEKKLEMATVVKDPSTGEMGTKELTVEGPTMFFSTDTLFEIDFEFANRCFMYYIDESTNQKALILKHLRFLETVEGQRYLKRANGFHHLHQNFQRLLKPVNVYNPYSEQLTFSILGDSSIRNQQKYLSLIKTITFLHQHQRPLKKDKDLGEYIEVTKEDIELAGKLLSEVMGKSTSELPPRTAYILEEINSYVKTKI